MISKKTGRDLRPCLIFGARAVPKLLVQRLLEELGESPRVIAADAGWRQALAHGLLPELVVGDFDSAGPPEESIWRELAGDSPPPEVLALPAEKDDTDLHFAAGEALRCGAKQVVLTGVLGGRMDHSFASLSTLLHLCQCGVKAKIIDAEAKVFCVLAGEKLTLLREAGVYLSVFPVAGQAAGVWEEGVKYPLKNAVLTADFPLGISNEFAADNAKISCEEGGLFVFMVKKDAPVF